MKVLGWVGLVALTCWGAAAETKPLEFADPFVFAEDGRYYAYGTMAAEGLAVATSTDLQNWTRHEKLVLKKGEGVYGTRHFWAPEVYKVDGRYLIFYTGSEGEQDGKFDAICVAESDSPLGPFRSRTKRPLIERNGSLDDTLFIDDDGSAYVFFVHYVTGAAIWMAPFDLKTLTLDYASAHEVIRSTEPWEIPANTNDCSRTCEGPFVVKENGLYYLTYSTHRCEDPDYNVCLATAPSVRGPWTKRGGRPILSHHAGLSGTGHHSFFRDLQGNWKIAFHSHGSKTNAFPRVMQIAEARFVKDEKGPWIQVSERVIGAQETRVASETP